MVLPFFQFPFSEGRREEIITVDGIQKIIGLRSTPLKGISREQKGFIGVFQDLHRIKKFEAEMKQKEKWAAIRGTFVKYCP